MQSNLIVTAVGTDQTGTVSRITQLINNCGCNILDSRMAIFGSDFTLIMLLNGDLPSISKIEMSLPALAGELDLMTMCKRAKAHDEKAYPLKFDVEYTGPDRAGVLSKVTEFFANRNVDLHSLKSDTYVEQGREMMRSNLGIGVHNDTDAEALSKDFEQLCQELDLSGKLIATHLASNENSENEKT